MRTVSVVKIASLCVALALSLPACAVDGSGAQGAHSPRTPEQGGRPMQSATAEAAAISARATFTISHDGQGSPLRVRYVVHNTSNGWLYAFDRGDTHAVRVKRQVLGAIAQPLEGATRDGTTLTHAPMPIGTPSPTSPPIPLAAALAAGTRYEGEFQYSIPPDRARSPLHYCLTIAPAGTDIGEPLTGSQVHRVVNAFQLARETLCTPWFDSEAFAFRER